MLSKIYKPKLKKGITRKLAKKTKTGWNEKTYKPKIWKRISPNKITWKIDKKMRTRTKKWTKFENEDKKANSQHRLKKELGNFVSFQKKEKTTSILTLYFEENT